MTKTIRMHQIQEAAKKLFSPKLSKLEKKIDLLAGRIRTLERQLGSVPIQQAEVIEEGAVLTKKKELSNASSSKR